MPTQRVIAPRKVLCTLGGLCCFAALAFAQEEMVKLELKLPRYVPACMPRPIIVTNLEPRDTMRPPIMVPKGIQNVALGKTVTASQKEPIIGKLAQITDGDKEAEDDSLVELEPSVRCQWVQVDLGAPHEIFAIAVWHHHGSLRVYRDVIIQVADDADFIQNVRTVFNNDHDNSSRLGTGNDKAYIDTREGRAVDCKGMKGRYVRLYSNGNNYNEANHYLEVEVYGRRSRGRGGT